jgi:hypothetical protein
MQQSRFIFRRIALLGLVVGGLLGLLTAWCWF